MSRNFRFAAHGRLTLQIARFIRGLKNAPTLYVRSVAYRALHLNIAGKRHRQNGSESQFLRMKKKHDPKSVSKAIGIDTTEKCSFAALRLPCFDLGLGRRVHSAPRR